MSSNQKTILIIEDDYDQQKMYGLLLERSGFRVLQAYDGEEGMRMVEEYIPDLILLDILMGDVSGIEVLRRIRQDERFSTIPVIVFTNYTHEDTLKKAGELGASEIIIKTNITPKELVELIQRKYLKSE